jgi:hypothetical protein
MWVHRDGTVGKLQESHFWWLNGVRGREDEFYTEGLVHVERVGVENLDVEQPLREALGSDKSNPGG